MQAFGGIVQYEEEGEQYRFVIERRPFRITHWVNNEFAWTINEKDTLFIADTAKLASDEAEPVALGFRLNTEHVFGLPERAANLLLNTTEASDPYYMFNTDRFPHFYQTNVSLYGSLPYLTAHSLRDSGKTMDASVMWMNSAPTWVDLLPIKDEKSILGTFNSMGGAIEFFSFASAVSPNKVQQLVSEISGYAPMPPLHSLGFHFSKYEYFTALSLAERSQNFTKFGFPVDVFWMDIEHTQEHMYFVFNYLNFTAEKLAVLNQEMESSDRFLVAITDPHLMADQKYKVFSQGVALEQQSTPENHINIFIRDENGEEPWTG